MERIKGLNEYVKNEKYRKALNLPNEQEEEYTMLAQGEYNINYSFTHPKTGKKLLLRVNCGSQMHLENQIGYECHALQLLEASGRTPKVLYVDGSRKFFRSRSTGNGISAGKSIRLSYGFKICGRVSG